VNDALAAAKARHSNAGSGSFAGQSSLPQHRNSMARCPEAQEHSRDFKPFNALKLPKALKASQRSFDVFTLSRGFARSTFSSAVAFPGCAIGAKLRNHGVQEAKLQCVMSVDVVIFHDIS
jgi:hypothetical protein